MFMCLCPCMLAGFIPAPQLSELRCEYRPFWSVAGAEALPRDRPRVSAALGRDAQQHGAAVPQPRHITCPGTASCCLVLLCSVLLCMLLCSVLLCSILYVRQFTLMECCLLSCAQNAVNSISIFTKITTAYCMKRVTVND